MDFTFFTRIVHTSILQRMFMYCITCGVRCTVYTSLYSNTRVEDRHVICMFTLHNDIVKLYYIVALLVPRNLRS